MRILYPSLIFASSLLEVVAADCNANNCLRAVIASAFPTRVTIEDCSSFMAVTVTPATFTITSTIATTTFTTLGEPPTVTVKRRNHNRHPVREVIEVRQVTVTPTAVPAYASACSGTVKYSSACSCIGVTRHTVTASTPVTTFTTSVTTTATVTPTGACPDSSFRFAILDETTGLYGILEPNPGVPDSDLLDFSTTDPQSASPFSFDSDCRLDFGPVYGLSAVVDTPGEFVDYHYVYIVPPSGAPGSQQTPVYCAVSVEDVLTCSVQYQDILQTFDDYLAIAATQEQDPVEVFKVVSV